MMLNLNSPAYHSKKYGVDSEIYNMCRELTRFVHDKKYSDIVDTVGIVPIVAPRTEIEAGKWNEEKKYDIKFKLVFVSKQIDYDTYCCADMEMRKELIIKNILDSVKSIHRKAKFDYAKFETDVKDFAKSYSD